MKPRSVEAPLPPEPSAASRGRLSLPDLALALVALATVASSASPTSGVGGAGISTSVTVTALVCMGLIVLAQVVPWSLPVTPLTWFPLAIAPAVPPLLLRLESLPRTGEPWPLHEIAYALEEYLAISAATGCFTSFRQGRPELLRLLSIVMMIVAGSTRSNPLYPLLTVAFAVATVLVMRHETARGARWSEKGRGLPVTLLACLVLAAALGLGISRSMGPFQRQFVELVTGVPSGSAVVDMSDAPHIGGLEHLQGSRRPVIRFVTDRPDPLRIGVAETYQDGTWRPAPPTSFRREGGLRRLLYKPEPVAAAASRALPAADPEEYRVPFVGRAGSGDEIRVRGTGQVILLAWFRNRIPCPLFPVAIQIRRILPTMDSYGLLTPSWRGADFWLVWGDGPASQRQLEPSERERYLQVPDALRADLRRAAEEAVGGPVAGPHDAQRAASRIQSWLQGLTYAARQNPPPGRDPVAWFVREQRQGHCEYFASAMALMLRSVGIPTRYVWGFQVSEAAEERGQWVVRERDAHAWVEVHVPGQGWTTWDPTPAAEREATHADVGGAAWEKWLESRFAKLRAALAYFWSGAWREGVARLLPSPQVIALAGSAILLGVLGLWVGTRLRRRSRRARNGQVSQDALPRLFRSFEQWLLARGVMRPATEAPGELAARLAQVRLPEDLRHGCIEFLEVYQRARYGEEPLLEELEERLEALRKLPRQ